MRARSEVHSRLAPAAAKPARTRLNTPASSLLAVWRSTAPTAATLASPGASAQVARHVSDRTALGDAAYGCLAAGLLVLLLDDRDRRMVPGSASMPLFDQSGSSPRSPSRVRIGPIRLPEVRRMQALPPVAERSHRRPDSSLAVTRRESSRSSGQVANSAARTAAGFRAVEASRRYGRFRFPTRAAPEATPGDAHVVGPSLTRKAPPTWAGPSCVISDRRNAYGS
jgi:hypothetical protein